MNHGLLPLLGHRATLVAIVLLAGAGLSACGVAGPSPHPQTSGAESGSARASGADSGSARTAAGGTHLLLRLGERRIYLMDDDPATPVESFPVAVGRQGKETPVGRFQVEEMIQHPDFHKMDTSVVPARIIKWFPPGPANPLGERWIGFTHGEGWTVGIHGTPNPELLGRAVSGGCVRMRNADVIRVYDRIQLGTAVVVEP